MGKMFDALEKAKGREQAAPFSRPVQPVPSQDSFDPPQPASPMAPVQSSPSFAPPLSYTPPVVRQKAPEDGDPLLDFMQRSGRQFIQEPAPPGYAPDGSRPPEDNRPSLQDAAVIPAPIPETAVSQGPQPHGDNYKAYIHPSMVTVLKPHSIEAEQFRLLKNNILFPEKGDPPRSIMVTSPSPDEGKSFVSTNLAVSIAQSIDEYVMLMDCDLRSPSIHALFGMENVEGLSDHLSSAIPLSGLLKKTFIEKLTVLPGGTIPPNPSELLSSEQMRRLLSEVKARYSDRYVIVDTPPPSITSETNAIARVVDGIILVIKYGKTKKKEVEDIVDIYGKDKILGIIKNFSRKPPIASHRYRGYGYIKE